MPTAEIELQSLPRTFDCCFSGPLRPCSTRSDRPTSSLACPTGIPPYQSLRTLHTRHHVKLVCFWKHTTRREALKFFLEQVQRFIYEIPRGWERQKSGRRRLSALPACIPAAPASSYYRPSSGKASSGEQGDLAMVPAF